MMEYNVKITDRALADMEAIYNYIANNLQAPDTAMKQYDRIADEIESFGIFPNRNKLFESQPEREMGMRQSLVDNYSAIYTVDEETDTVFVLRVLYSASDIITRLRENR